MRRSHMRAPGFVPYEAASAAVPLSVERIQLWYASSLQVDEANRWMCLLLVSKESFKIEKL